MQPDYPLAFEALMFRVTLDQFISEKLGIVFRDLCKYAKEIPYMGDARALTEQEKKQWILEMMQFASKTFFLKMLDRVEHQAPQERSESE